MADEPLAAAVEPRSGDAPGGADAAAVRPVAGDASRPEPAGTDRRASHVADDTVTLRELYLVVKTGLPLILAAALVCGLAAFGYRTLQGATFTTTAVVQVVQPRVSTQPGSGLDVSVASPLNAPTYRAIALSPALLYALADDLGLEEVTELGELDVVAGPGASSGDAIGVTHVVTVPTARGAEWAATVANAWADATVEAARDVLLAPFTEAGGRVASDLAARESAYQEASEAWADFLAVDERDELRSRLESLVELEASRRARLSEAEAEAEALRARIATLRDAGQPTTGPEADLAALTAEAEHLRGEQEASAAEAADLRQRLGELERQAAELQRRVSTTSLAYFRAAPAAAELQLQRELAAGAVHVAIPAAVPLEPDPRNTLLTVLAALIVGALGGTLYVFLREAIREPGPA